MKFLLLFVLVMIGQSLAYHDDVTQDKINKQSATWVVDNVEWSE